MKKKGFTLIELLAVIVILAILALILTPMIQDLILNVKKSAFERSIDGILAAAEYYSVEHPGVGDITFECDGNSCEDSNGNKLVFKGEVPISGTIILSKNGVVAENLCNSSFCGSGSRRGLLVDVGGVNISTCDKYYSLATIGTTWEYNFVTNNDVQTIYNFDYTGGEQKFIVPTTGTYVVETWGAQGGSASGSTIGGYGGYSKGIINLSRGMVLYVNVGGQGESVYGNKLYALGGYNGGGKASTNQNNLYRAAGGGGGATHFATKSGELKNLEIYKGTLSNDAKYYVSNEIIIVAGGGGGTWDSSDGTNAYKTTVFGHGGGAVGVLSECIWNNAYNTSGAGGSQISGYAFGLGQGFTEGLNEIAGAGGGFFGGSAHDYAAGGGSGYIANPSLSDKAMYCYDCEESTEANIYTISTTGDNKDSSSCPNGYASSPTTNCAKSGNGYARITLLNVDTKCNPSSVNSQGFIAPNTGNYKLEVWGAAAGNAKIQNGTIIVGGKGGYSTGEIHLEKDDKLYVTVGGMGENSYTEEKNSWAGGFNGGGSSSENSHGSGGGGATHIATSAGELYLLESNKSAVLIVAGGGGGSSGDLNGGGYCHGGSGGGTAGGQGASGHSDFGYGGYGGTQDSGYAFGQGCNGSRGTKENETFDYGAGGGGGYYGGTVGASTLSQYPLNTTYTACSGGGSGYIGSLSNASTIAGYENMPTFDGKSTMLGNEGNGYAKITYIGN